MGCDGSLFAVKHHTPCTHGMFSLDECKKHIRSLELPDDEVEKIRDLLYAFVERTLDYGLEKGMFVVAHKPCHPTDQEN